MNKHISNSFTVNLIVAVLLSASFVTLLNQTLLLVALPHIMSDLNISTNQAQWLTTAFLMMNGILIPISAFLIEKYSTRSLLITALTLFLIGTLLGALAPNFNVLLFARIVQACGAGILMPLMQTVFMIIFSREKRGAAMGMVGLVQGFAPAIGPTLSGWILDQYSWRYLFYIVIPVACIVLLLAIFLMKNVTEQKPSKVDMPSIVFSTLGWGGLLYGFSMIGSLGLTNPAVLAAIVVGGGSLLIFIRKQLRMEHPMLEFRVFQVKEFSLATILLVIVFAMLIGMQTLLPIFTQNIQGSSALYSGMILLPGTLIMGFMSPVAGKIYDKFGSRKLSIVGFSCIVVALCLLMTINVMTSLIFIAFAFVLIMFGISLNFVPLMTASMNALTPDLIPHGSAMSNTIRMVGGSIGTAMLISVMSGVSGNMLAESQTVALLNGMLAAFGTAGVMAIIGLIISFKLEKKVAVESQAAQANS